MKPILLTFFALLLTHSYAQSWFLELFFDGADTTDYSMSIRIDSSAENLWQVGPPQKMIFNNAFTLPNALVTDTVNNYPENNVSTFEYDLNMPFEFGIAAIQWTQKIDIDSGDVGIVEFSIDSGVSWINAFDSPYTYNFYGFENEHIDTLPDGRIGFSGTDTNWRDIWLCFDYSWVFMQDDSIIVRHSFISDSVASNHEGWMIDNFLQHLTGVHTIGEKIQENYIEVFPNPSSDRINISVKKENTFHIIEALTLMNESSVVLENYENVPTKFFIRSQNYPNGVYYLKIRTNLRTETKKIIIQH